jgi:hypothetical protein
MPTLTCRCGAQTNTTFNKGEVDRVAQETNWRGIMASPVTDIIWLCPTCAAKTSQLILDLVSVLNPQNGPWEPTYPSQIDGTPISAFLTLKDKNNYRLTEGTWNVSRTTGFRLKN